MQYNIPIEMTVNIKYIVVKAYVRYWEDTEVNGVEDTDGTLIPFREGDCWCPIIDIDEGKIINWPSSKEAKIHYKVCDACYCELLTDQNVVVSKYDGYVPNILCPEDGGYGDYIIMNVNGDGIINKWDVKYIDELVVNTKDEEE